MSTQTNPNQSPLDRLWRKAFLSALRECGTLRHACEAAGVSRATVYEVRKGDPAFAAEFEQAIEDFADTLEVEAVRRAKGTRELVIYQGRPCGVWVNDDGVMVAEGTPGARLVPLTESRYSDGLLMFTLKGYKREKYGERKGDTAADPSAPPAVIEMPENGSAGP